MKTDTGGISPDDLFTKARDRALRLLTYRSRSRKEIEAALGINYPPDIIARVLELMDKYNYLDDANYAAEYAESKALKGYGRLRIRHELKQKGISEDIINDVLADIVSDEAEEAADLLNKRLKGDTDADYAEKRRCYSFLSRRGYSSCTILKAFKIYFDEYEG